MTFQFSRLKLHLAEKVTESQKIFLDFNFSIIMNVTGWRDEPAPLPLLAARMVRWLHSATPDSHAGSDEIAAQLARAWRELLGARAVALWTLTENGRLEPLGRDGEFDEQIAPDAHIEFARSAWPTHLFWVAQGNGATRDLATTLGLMSEMVAAPSLCVPLGECGLALAWLETDDGLFDEQWQELLEPIAVQSGVSLQNALRVEKMGRSFHQLAGAMAAAIDGREAHREGYSNAVAYYAGLIGREMNLNEGDRERIEFAALWHGLGRLSVPDAILQKDAPLSPEELDQVRGAAQWGADKLSDVEGLEKVAAIVRHQNEHFDGSGAPDALSGHTIPVGSRVLAVAARFAAMTTARADRAPLSVVGGAMDSLAESAGKALDPDVVKAFFNAMGRAAS